MILHVVVECLLERAWSPHKVQVTRAYQSILQPEITVLPPQGC